MASNKYEDRALAKLCRTAFAKTSLDVSQLEVYCSDGNVELAGKVKEPRGHPGGMDIKKELQNLKNHIRTIRGVREVYDTRVSIIR
jgi:hypothetical protein